MDNRGKSTWKRGFERSASKGKFVMAMDDLKTGDVRIFAKSGNTVRLIEREGEGWVVERTTGASAGKQMWCPSRSLVKSLDSE